MPSDEDTYKLTEADRTSETRFGPRPVPPGHHRSDDYPFRERTSSRVIPSGRVSPDGRSAYPTPSLASKIVVWGGIAVGVAGATAATVMAARKVGDMLGDDKVAANPSPRRRYKPQSEHIAPRFAELDEDEREEMRSRVRARARNDEYETARLRASASRRRKPKRNLADELTETATNLSSGLDGVTNSLVGAFDGFRSVAGQASKIVSEFALAADVVRGILQNNEQRAAPPQREYAADATENVDAKQERERLHRL